PPPVLLTQVVMDEQIIAAYGGVVSFETATNLKVLNTPLRLPPTHRHLEFDFTAFHFSAPENIHFRYQLVGFDTNWIDAGTERSANYSRLPAGQYHFSVEACVGAGPWSEPPTLLAITVIPFFWQAWWFRLGVVLLFTSCVIVFARYISIRRIKMQMRLLEKRAVLDTERTRIARDLHDELGSSLNYISMSLGDMGRSQEMPAKQFYARLEKISGFAVRTVRSLDEIVWAVNPRNDSLRSLVDYITQFATELFEDRNIHCRFHVEENLPQRRLTLETRHHLFLIVKEALGNALVHAHPSEVRLGVRMVGPQVEIYIQDNGIGFDRRSIEANGGNNGLKNMQQRIETIRGRLVIQTKPGDGTTIRLVVDVPQPDRSRISA
ncbi:MAG: ATP-binding protein, partial [Limisphaerales bacterium]